MGLITFINVAIGVSLGGHGDDFLPRPGKK